jgi:hypothetical protein
MKCAAKAPAMAVLSLFKKGIIWGFLAIMSALWLTGAHCAPAKAETQRFVSARFNLSIDYPDSLELAHAERPQVIVLLKNKAGPLPTLNIIEEPGAYDFNAAISRQSDKIISSYKLVGFLDAAPLSARIEAADNKAFFRAEIAYSHNNQEYVSAIAIFSGSQRHLIVTFVDRADAYPQHRQWLEPILLSINAPDLSAALTEHRPLIYLPYLIVFLAAAAALIMWRRRRA